MSSPPQSSKTNSIANQLGELRKLASDIKGLLGSQRDILSKAGLRLPPGVSDGLTHLATNLERTEGLVSEHERELSQLHALVDLGQVINSSLDLTTVLNEVMDTIIRLMGAERGFLMLRNSDGELDFRIARNLEQETLAETDFEISRTIVTRVAAMGESVVTTNAQEDPRFGKQESVVAYNLRSILCVPLQVKGVVTGVIYADNRIRTGLFNERDRDLMTAFANQAAVAIENARLFESVKQTLDEVTAVKSLMDNVFASIASGVITTDVQDTIILCNRAAGEIFGLEPGSAVGSHYDTVLPPLGGTVRESIERAKTKDEQTVGYEVNPILANRGAVDLTFNLTPLKDAEQTTQGVAIVVDDITERKKLRSKYELFQRMIPPAVVEQLNLEDMELGGERQQISCLFADIRGFSTFSEYLDPVQLLNVLNRYLGAAAEAVLLHEGTLDKFLGDAVMAVFNAPLPQPDHAMRAMRAALNMREAIHALHAEFEPEFRLEFGVGINVGEAVVGLVGTNLRVDYTAIGDSVNIAKRLQENSGPNQILLSSTAYEAVQGQVTVKELEPMSLKGREQRVQVYDLIDML